MRIAAVFVLAIISCAELSSQGAAQQSVKPDEARTHAINGIGMYVETYGTGAPLLLLHGFGSCGRMWTPFVGELAKQFQVIVPDLRGHGRSTNPAGGFTHRQAARDVTALLDALKIDRVRAMGVSTGGMTLLHLATTQRQRVEAMVLIGATHYFPEQARAIMRKEGQGAPSTGVLEYYRRCASRGDTQAGQLLREFGAFNDSYDDMNFTAPYLGTIQARTLIVHGDRDEFFPVEIPMEMYRSIPNAQLWIVPAGDHVPIFGARARAFHEIATSFLLKASGAERRDF